MMDQLEYFLATLKTALGVLYPNGTSTGMRRSDLLGRFAKVAR